MVGSHSDTVPDGGRFDGVAGVIAALVTDIGSSVSHGAVVAREYGLPCVVNTIDATRTLRTGDRVRVDGDRGVVTQLEG